MAVRLSSGRRKVRVRVLNIQPNDATEMAVS